ncbi:MAG: membrane protein insertion efficiency factor YidD [Desulfohalobiaceae bacterium]
MAGDMRKFLLGMVLLYQRLCSPFFPSCCRFYPSCSEYAAQAIQIHGALKGGMLSVWRFLRCHPLARSGLDPVPEPCGEKPAPRSREVSFFKSKGVLGSNPKSSMHKGR